jgi:hypothetical protein
VTKREARPLCHGFLRHAACRKSTSPPGPLAIVAEPPRFRGRGICDRRGRCNEKRPGR